MILDVRTIRKVRTEEEKRRRHLFGDAGAKFSQRKLEMGGGIMNSLTTFVEKDNIIFEILWI